MKIGWLVDDTPGVVGGAELTQAEFRAAAPDGVEIVDCPTGDVVADLDGYVIHNCVTYTVDDLAVVHSACSARPTERVPVVKYWHDVGPHVAPAVRDWLNLYSVAVCCSPLQADAMGIAGAAALIPPPVDLSRFTAAAAHVNGDRAGAVSVASWGNPGKAPQKAAEWGSKNGGVVFFGGGASAPPGSEEVPQSEMPDLLAHYKQFVFLPTALEPFGRIVAEAWAAGCEIVTNQLVGARYWLEENPAAIDTAAEDFWKLVLK